jgi:ADP-ribose pyrophosphatase YjhB (NUDIX family)
MGLDSILKGDKKEIFEMFAVQSELKFSDIEKSLKQKGKTIRSNMIAYHLYALKKEKIIEKSGEYWRLTKEYEKIIPLFSNLSQMTLGPVCVVLVMAINKQGDKILLVKRDKKPYKDYWSILAKKMQIKESVTQAALRCVKEEVQTNAKFKKTCAILHERLKENDEYKHAFLFVLTKVEVKENDEKTSNDKSLKWFDINKLEKNKFKKEKIIPSDVYMINNFLKKKTVLSEIIMEEKNKKLRLKFTN